MENVIPQQWASPCGNQCTHKYAALMQIPWRVFCKKGCNADGDTWEECLAECDEICYKDPVLKDQQWSAYIDRSPGAVNYSQHLRYCLCASKANSTCLASRLHKTGYAFAICKLLVRNDEDHSHMEASREDCFNACVTGCGYKFEICKEKVDQVRPRPLPSEPLPELKPPTSPAATKPDEPAEDVPSTSA
ncbi:hypothetical protein GOBAR_AA32126 [Gossypium barbadense]|uniref:Uncharacterized protein n=1 Tax=Gossypium barbadense TaxID=3634 RepID=A0A2P5WBU0_GOSBA|nr:hypothetical protein GOBAR_AA32126 [Gossypium barbadense]